MVIVFTLIVLIINLGWISWEAVKAPHLPDDLE